MIILEKGDYPAALALFKNSRHQMKLPALAEGRIEAQVWADGLEPAIAIVLYQNKLLIASELSAEALVPELKPFLLEQAYEKKMGCNAEEALVFWDGEHVREAVLTALDDRCPAYALREYYELVNPAGCKRTPPPWGYKLRAADAALLGEGLGRACALKEEMRSERASVEAFLRGSFGVCAVYGGEIAGWCLSEYNCSLGCEVGIEVGDCHRRRGLALAMVSAFAEEAARRGVGNIGWHCLQYNKASSATALSAGFSKALEYGEILCFFGLAMQFAFNGNMSDGAERFEEAAEWYGRAVSLPGAPLWAGVRLAIAYTSLGRFDEAIEALDDAIRKGFNGWAWLRSEPRLEPLRGEDAWKQLF